MQRAGSPALDVPSFGALGLTSGQLLEPLDVGKLQVDHFLEE
jgi:hypothetical protein